MIDLTDKNKTPVNTPTVDTIAIKSKSNIFDHGVPSNTIIHYEENDELEQGLEK